MQQGLGAARQHRRDLPAASGAPAVEQRLPWPAAAGPQCYAGPPHLRVGTSGLVGLPSSLNSSTRSRPRDSHQSRGYCLSCRRDGNRRNGDWEGGKG
jgi:hypothetical protein